MVGDEEEADKGEKQVIEDKEQVQDRQKQTTT